MTLNDIFDEYAEKKYTAEDKKEHKYTAGAEERHKYLRKKLISACNCLGLDNLSFLKNESGKYEFEANVFQKNYIMLLLDKEQSALFKKIRKGEKLDHSDYLNYIEELQNLFYFVKAYVKDEEFLTLKENIIKKIRYPILRKYYEERYFLDLFKTYMKILVLDRTDEDDQTICWEYLYESDKIRLFEEIMQNIKKSIALFENVAEERFNEFCYHATELSNDERIFGFVDAEINNIPGIETIAETSRANEEQRICKKFGLDYDEYLNCKNKKQKNMTKHPFHATTDEIFERTKNKIK